MVKRDYKRRDSQQHLVLAFCLFQVRRWRHCWDWNYEARISE